MLLFHHLSLKFKQCLKKHLKAFLYKLYISLYELEKFLVKILSPPWKIKKFNINSYLNKNFLKS